MMNKDEILDELLRLRSDLDRGLAGNRPQNEIDRMIMALNYVIKDLTGEEFIEACKRYDPVCPKGFTDCVCDPAYIKYYHPDWYKSLYEDLSPKDSADIYCSVREEGCYEDEDK